MSPWPWLAGSAALFVVWRVVVWVTDAVAAAGAAVAAAWPWLLAAALVPAVGYVALVAAAWWSIRDLPTTTTTGQRRMPSMRRRLIARANPPVQLQTRHARQLPPPTVEIVDITAARERARD